MTRPQIIGSLISVLFTGSFLCAASAVAAISVTTSPLPKVLPLVLRGDAAPLEGVTTSFDFFTRTGFGINERGDLAFLAWVDVEPPFGGPGARYGVWLRNQDGLRSVALEQESYAIDGTQRSLSELNKEWVGISNSGDVAFVEEQIADNFAFDTIWLDRRGVLSQPARPGALLPAAPGPLKSLRHIEFTREGRLGFTAETFGGFGAWAEDDNQVVQLLAKTAQFELQTVVPIIEPWSLELNDAGDAAMMFSRGQPPPFMGPAIISHRNGSSGVVAVEELTGPTPGVVWQSIHTPQVNQQGQTIFVGYYGETYDFRKHALYIADGAVTPLVEPGDPISNAPGYTVEFITEINVNNRNDVLFDGGMRRGASEPFESGLFVARQGEVVALMPDCFELGGSQRACVPSFSRDIAFNNAGQIAFRSQITGPGVDQTNDDSIWATDLHGNLVLVAREGSVIELAPGDQRTLREISFAANEEVYHPYTLDLQHFNDRGQVAFWGRFTNNTEGIFISNIVAIPEPSTGAALSAALALFAVVKANRSRTTLVKRQVPVH